MLRLLSLTLLFALAACASEMPDAVVQMPTGFTLDANASHAPADAPGLR